MTDFHPHKLKDYELREKMTSGNFSVLYRAYQSSVERDVVVRIVLPEHANQSEFVRRFEIEAQLIARLEHPHIVPLYDYWRDPEGAYLVMRWLPFSLRKKLEQGAWSLEATARLLEQIAGALAVAHREGVIHRNLKPENILLDEDGNAYLTDFGIVSPVQSGISEAAAYLTPEQIRGETLTARTDIYSLGVIAYEMLVAKKPFSTTSSEHLISDQLNTPVPMLASQQTAWSAALDEVLQTATAKNPEQRYANALRFAAAFRASLPNRQRSTEQPLAEPLTARELEILKLIVDGLSNPALAERLVLSPTTIKWYTRQIYGKLDVHSRQQAIDRTRQLQLFNNPTMTSVTHLSASSETLADVLKYPAPPEPLNLANPYKGLQAFQETDATIFFGRASLTQQLVNRFEGEDAPHFLALVGPSGSGKSSVIRAGLIPALHQGALPNSSRWFITDMLPGVYPFEGLAAALLRISVNTVPNILEQVTEDQRGLSRLVKQLLPSDEQVELVLVIDQFEELFTLVQDETVRAQFIDSLLNAVSDPQGRMRVVLTLRADFYDRPLHYPRLAELIRHHTEVIVPLNATELEQAILEPAQQVGLTFEDGLVATMLQDVGQPGTLPLLEYALSELYERSVDRQITLAAYQELGGISGALAQRVEKLYAEMTPDHQELTRQMFLRLVDIGDDRGDARRRVRREELLSLTLDADAMDELIDTFAAYRLLTLDHDAGSRSPTVEVAHEAILREWRRLSTWIEESREDIKMRQQLDHIAQEWAAKGKEVSYLASGQRLAQFEDWASAKRQALTVLERAYVEASLTERAQQEAVETERQARETRLERRSRRFLRGLVIVLLLATLGAFGLTAYATNQSNLAVAARQQAEDQARIATSRELVGYATDNLDKDAELSTLLAIQAVKTTYDADATVLPEANAVLHQAIDHLNPPARIKSADLPPDLTLPIGWSDDKTIVYPQQFDFSDKDQSALSDVSTGKVLAALHGTLTNYAPFSQRATTFSFLETSLEFEQWDISSSQNPRQTATVVLPIDPNQLQLIDVSLDLHYVAVGTMSDVYSVWDTSTGQQIIKPSILNACTHAFNPLFSPDSTLLVLCSASGGLSMIDTATWEERTKIPTPGVTPIAAFSPNGQQLATANMIGDITIWNTLTGTEITSISSGTQARAIAISADGKYVAAGRKDGTLIVWDITSGRVVLHEGVPFTAGLAFSPDSSRIAALSTQSEVLVWNIIPKPASTVLMNSGVVPDDGVVDMAYSPDGNELVAASVSDTPIVWNVKTGQPIFNLTGDTKRVLATAWSADGAYIATGGEDTNVILWNAKTGDKVQLFEGHTDNIYALAFSPDNTRLASSSYDKTVRIWDVSTGKLVMTLEQPAESRGVVWSPDGSRVAAGTLLAPDGQGHILTWNADTGEQVQDISVGASRTGIVAFSPDGTRVVAGLLEDSVAQVWDALTGKSLLRLEGHTYVVPGVAYNSDGTRIATVSLDATARVWDANSGQELLTLDDSAGGAARVAFSPDGKHLATENEDGTTRIYVLDIDELIALAQSRLTRTWTAAECQRYLHTETCPA